MKAAFALLLLVAFAAAQDDSQLRGLEAVEDHPHKWNLEGAEQSIDGVITLWHKFTAFFKKTYSTAEREVRLLTFKKNLEFINKTNKSQKSFKLGLTPFTDLSFEEFREAFLLKSVGLPSFEMQEHVMSGETADKEKDWVKEKALTPVKNQGDCGSCWAFSTIASLESHNFIKTGDLVSLSEQELVDCATSHYDNHGCKGGLYTHAFDFIKDNGGVNTEKNYPYVCDDQEAEICVESKCKKDGKKIADVSGYVQCRDEDEMVDATAKKGPVSIAVEVTAEFQHYTGGILHDSTCGKQLNHAIVVVGYGEDEGEKFWKIRNSWGPSWGEEGYIRMPRGKDACGLATIPVYPVMA